MATNLFKWQKHTYLCWEKSQKLFNPSLTPIKEEKRENQKHLQCCLVNSRVGSRVRCLFLQPLPAPRSNEEAKGMGNKYRRHEKLKEQSFRNRFYRKVVAKGQREGEIKGFTLFSYTNRQVLETHYTAWSLQVTVLYCTFKIC